MIIPPRSGPGIFWKASGLIKMSNMKCETEERQPKMEAKRPRIAIPEIRQNLSAKNYTRAVHEAGMEPVVISSQAHHLTVGLQREYMDYGQFRAEQYDGLLLPGGGDINPSLYGEANHGSVMIQDELDDLQLKLLSSFLELKKPVLGICRGMQLLNVFFGGSLFQNLDTAFRHTRKQDESDQVHDSVAGKDSWIGSIYGEHFFHNSAHHQGVRELGEGLSVDSRSAADGVVEATHHVSLPVYAVQWHPERMCLAFERVDTVNGLPVFQFFCRLCGGEPLCRAYAASAEIMDGMMGL